MPERRFIAIGSVRMLSFVVSVWIKKLLFHLLIKEPITFMIMHRNNIRYCAMGIRTDWEAQSTYITQNLLHDNQRAA